MKQPSSVDMSINEFAISTADMDIDEFLLLIWTEVAVYC